jgi:hypothetical protein
MGFLQNAIFSRAWMKLFKSVVFNVPLMQHPMIVIFVTNLICGANPSLLKRDKNK